MLSSLALTTNNGSRAAFGEPLPYDLYATQLKPRLALRLLLVDAGPQLLGHGERDMMLELGERLTLHLFSLEQLATTTP